MVRALHDYFRAAGFMVLEAKDGAEALQLFYENARRINIILLDVILADEPTGNLDSASSREIMEILKGMHRSGETLILITHDNGIAAQARRVVRIMDGKIESDTINEEFVEEA